MQSRERDLSCLIDLVQAAYPGLAVSDQLDLWMEGKLAPPYAFVLIESAAVQANTLTSYKMTAKARIALHHPRYSENGVERYDPLSPEPLRRMLADVGFDYRGPTDGLLIYVDSQSFKVEKDKKERTVVTFSFEYTVPLPREQATRINQFELESEVK